MNFWDKVKTDLQRGVEEGIALVRESASVVMKKTEELTDEGKRRYRIFDLKTRVQKEVSELGGRVYELSDKVTNPMRDGKVKAVQSRIKKLEAEILKLESKPAPRSEKAPLKRKPKKTGMTTIKTKGKTPAAGSTRGATVAPAKN